MRAVTTVVYQPGSRLVPAASSPVPAGTVAYRDRGLRPGPGLAMRAGTSHAGRSAGLHNHYGDRDWPAARPGGHCGICAVTRSLRADSPGHPLVTVMPRTRG